MLIEWKNQNERIYLKCPGKILCRILLPGIKHHDPVVPGSWC